MSWENARNFIVAELAESTVLPRAYNVYIGDQQKAYRVVVIGPDEVTHLTRIRKNAGITERNINGIDAVNFAPTGGCPCCIR